MFTVIFKISINYLKSNIKRYILIINLRSVRSLNISDFYYNRQKVIKNKYYGSYIILCSLPCIDYHGYLNQSNFNITMQHLEF